MVNITEIVNIFERIQHDVYDAGISLHVQGDKVSIVGPVGTKALRLVPLYRPSVTAIENSASPDTLLVLTAASPKAVMAASSHNYVLAPGDRYRIMAPGLALIREAAAQSPVEASRQVRLTGLTGVLAETLLLGGEKPWSLQDLAAQARVSPSLAHRVVIRLEQQGCLTSFGHGRNKLRTVSRPQSLADLWASEERSARPFLKGYLYGSSVETVADKVLRECPGSTMGAALAANHYLPFLTRVPPPALLWVPEDFVPERLTRIGFEPTTAGANLELVQAKHSPWRIHTRTTDGIRRVSPWRAWLEVSQAEGRTQELAEALRIELEQTAPGQKGANPSAGNDEMGIWE